MHLGFEHLKDFHDDPAGISSSVYSDFVYKLVYLF